MHQTLSIVEDHDTMRASLKSLLESTTDLNVRNLFSSAEDLLQSFRNDHQARTQYVIADLSLPEMSGLELIKIISREWPEVRCLVLSGQTDPGYVQRSLDAGACAFVLKGQPSEILQALKKVAAGQTYISPVVDRIRG